MFLQTREKWSHNFIVRWKLFKNTGGQETGKHKLINAANFHILYSNPLALKQTHGAVDFYDKAV